MREEIEKLKWQITMEDLKGRMMGGHHYVRVRHVNAKLLTLKFQILALLAKQDK